MDDTAGRESPLAAAVDDPEAAAERAAELLAAADEATFRDRLGL